mmetsp:Transcript_21250/g.36026  ORF Transcript_21250/g.36026 Transcript_21250/m.36026 type:complete len:195 (-) Transcript_21250:625-1209(-)
MADDEDEELRRQSEDKPKKKKKKKPKTDDSGAAEEGGGDGEAPRKKKKKKKKPALDEEGGVAAADDDVDDGDKKPAAKKKKKKKKHSFFSFVLLMLQIGKEADAQMEKGGSINTGRKKLRDRLRRRSSVDSSDHSFASFTSAPSERSASSEAQADGKDMHYRRPSHRRSLTRYIYKRLSLSKKKSQSSVDTEQS